MNLTISSNLERRYIPKDGIYVRFDDTISLLFRKESIENNVLKVSFKRKESRLRDLAEQKTDKLKLYITNCYKFGDAIPDEERVISPS